MKRFTRPLLDAFAFIALTLLLGCGSGGGGGAQSPILSVAQSTVTFNSAFGASDPAPTSVNMTNTGGGALSHLARPAIQHGFLLLLVPGLPPKHCKCLPCSELSQRQAIRVTSRSQPTVHKARLRPLRPHSTWRGRPRRIHPLGPSGEPIRSTQAS